MKVYKGTDKDMRCRGYQFDLGVTAETDEAELCKKGFHACEKPLDVFKYYPPASSRYFEAELEDVSDERRDDTKVVGKKITLLRELTTEDLVQAQIDYCEKNGEQKNTSVSGNCGAASAGYHGVASAGYHGAASAGYRGAASAGDYGVAASRGSVIVGECGCGVVRGNGVKIKGGLGAVLVICEEKHDSYEIECCKSVVVDGDTVKADTWYCLIDGELKEVE